MAESEVGKRDSMGEWQPHSLPVPSPLFAWPWSPRAAFRDLWNGFWPFNLIYIGLAVIVWLYFTPSIETTRHFEFGWIIQIYLRNAALLTLIAGGLHLRLYIRRSQGQQYKYSDHWLAENDGEFLFNNQTRDNMFWSLTSGCGFWTAYEAATLWAFSNEIIPYVDFREHPVYCIVMIWVIMYFRYLHFYFIHRASHWKPLFNLSHYLHHKNINVGPWSGLSMDPIEHFLYFSSVLLHWIVPSSPFHAVFHLMHGAITPAMGHSGFHRLLTTDGKTIGSDAYFHYLHHKHFNVNFGVQEFPLDWWFNTYNDGSHESSGVTNDSTTEKPEGWTSSLPSQRPLIDGWLDVCASSALASEEAHRFDHDQRSFALYRTADRQVHATDGFCTHGNEHLAEGRVRGHIIQCAKHHGSFDVRDGRPVRLPVCVGLKTYPVKETDGRLWVNLRTAGGAGVTHAAVTHHFTVISNHNVATYIKELILEPQDGHPAPDYQPGDYLQLDIPAYAERSLQTLDIDAPYRATWQAQNTFALSTANPAPCRRNYSLASNPERERTLRFNVRLATPPRGLNVAAGIGSTYIFGLKPGDTVTAIGPFGDFHVKDTPREMIYLGGGAGMAPLRAHLSHLLETRGSTARISYWYGARSRQELFYEDYFTDLARAHPNFSFHVALSEAQPDDAWTGATGFIHDRLQHDYLDAHADPKSIDYFLCGPPAMIKAATAMLARLGVDPARIAFDEF